MQTPCVRAWSASALTGSSMRLRTPLSIVQKRTPDQAHRVNAVGAALLAGAATAIGCRVLQISTDFVFSGEQSRPYRPDAATGPVNVYGMSKLGGEVAAVNETAGKALIVRTSWVYATRGQNFVLRMLELMRSRQELSIVADQVGSPTWASSLASALWSMAGKDLNGVHHWADAGVASWYDFAVAIQDEALERKLLVRPSVLAPDSHGRISHGRAAARLQRAGQPLGRRLRGNVAQALASQPWPDAGPPCDRAVRQAARTLLPCTSHAGRGLGGLHAPVSAASCGGGVTACGSGPPGKLPDIAHLLEVIKYARVVRTGCAVL